MATKRIPVNTASVSGSHSDFPFYLKPSAMSGWGSLTTAEAESLRLYEDADLIVEVAREVVSSDEIHGVAGTFDDTYECWADYDGIRSDYATTATYGAEAVWPDYILVYHLSETSGSTVIDSTGANDGTYSASFPNNATGKIGDAQDALNTSNPDSYYLDTPSITVSGAGTIQFWKNEDSKTGPNPHFTREGVQGNDFFIHRGSDDAAWARMNGTDVVGGDISNFGQWYSMVATTDGSSAAVYVDGSSVSTGSAGWSIGSKMQIFGFEKLGGDGYDPIDGKMDEYRIRASVLPATWIADEHNNQNDVASFWGTVTDAGGGVTPNNSARRLFLMTM